MPLRLYCELAVPLSADGSVPTGTCILRHGGRPVPRVVKVECCPPSPCELDAAGSRA